VAEKRKTRVVAYDSAAFLDTQALRIAYIEEAMATRDPAFIASALGTVARAQGMARVARKSGLTRESLYKALSKKGNPEFATVLRVVDALGLHLSVTQRSRVRRRAKPSMGAEGSG
jgi:probable addiction module antidote protein